MKKRLLGLFLCSGLVLPGLRAVEINFTSPAFEIGTTSLHALLTSGFTFSLGSFGSFTPTVGNVTQWQGNFSCLGLIAWNTDFTQYSQTTTLAANTAPFGTTTLAYVWGYNSQSVSPGSEWILLKNPNWLFPASDTLLPVLWDASDPGTIAIVGHLGLAQVSSDPYMQTASIGPSVPEPATYAAIFGAVALGFAAYKRRRAD